MLKRSLLLVAMLLITSPTGAQELAVEPSSSTEGILLIHSGSFMAAGSYAESAGCEGHGDNLRQQVSEVRFDPPFRELPQVIITLNVLDFGVHVRVRARAENLTPESMTLIVETWCDTTMHNAGGTYFAMGQSIDLELQSDPADAEALEPAPVLSPRQEPPPEPEQQPSDLPENW